MKLCIILLLFITSHLYANDLSHANKMTKTPEYNKIKRVYERCVIQKGIEFVKVSSPSEAIKHAPIACKRELLAIKQFFLSSAFKNDIINALVQSVKEGAEIDLVNAVYKERAKYF